MLSIHYVSIMMRIFYTDWQQHWGLGMPPNREYWWSTKQPQVTDLPRWQFGFQWRRRGIELVFKSLDCFTLRPFFAATYVFVVWNFTRLMITRLKSFFFVFFLTSIWWGSTQLQCIYPFTICALYWSLGRRGYFGVSNVVLVISSILAGLWLIYISSVEITLFILADISMQHRAFFFRLIVTCRLRYLCEGR